MPHGVPAEAPVASFDSAAATLAATANVLHGRDFPLVGAMSPRLEPALEPLGRAINRLPTWAREQVYIWSGRQEAIPPERLGEVQAEHLARWATSHYPRRRYPAVAIGSSNGAAVHLWAALGIPWLPQTLLIPVRRSGVPPDEPRRELDWGRGPAARLLAANPDLQLHHMHDPNQDRLMVQRMAYFRVKHRRLPRAYARFLEETLAPGGTLIVVECGLCWPTTCVGERHLFQFGALGGLPAGEYVRGSPRVAEFLERAGSPRRRWDPPEPDGERPEAEWGFLQASLRADVDALVEQRGYRVRQLRFATPEDLSPLVADLYRWWYAGLGRPANRLLAESFVLLEPYWALRAGWIPFWMVFNAQSSALALERYLAGTQPAIDDLGLMLFSHGAESAGLASIEQWRSILGQACRGQFIGVDEHAYPRDFAVFARYHAELKRRLPDRYPLPAPLSLEQFETFLHLDTASGRYAVEWR